MTDIYKCMACGFTANIPGEHCGQAMVKQVPTEPEIAPAEPAPAANPAPTESPASDSNTQQ